MSGRNLSSHDNNYCFVIVGLQRSMTVHDPPTLPTGKRLLGRPRHRCEINIRMLLKEISFNTWNLVYSSRDKDYWRALVNTALNLGVS